MASKTPIKATFSGSDVSGLAEYTASDFISLADGGLGASLTIGSAGQVLKVNTGASALEFGSVEAIVNIDGATDLESATLAVGDKILLSDGGTEGRVLLSQLDTLFSGTSKTLTNKTINSNANTLHIDLDDLGTFTGSLAEFNAGLQGDSFVSLTGTETLTNKTLTSAVLNTGVSGSAVLDEDNFASNSATKLATQQSIKAYVDSQAHLSLIDEDDMSSDSATRPPSQQSVKAYVDAQEHAVTATSTTTFTNKTLTSPVLNTGVSGSAILDEDAMGSNSATQLATQQSIKAYVDAKVTAEDLDITTDSGTIAIDLDSETLTVTGGTGIDSSATGNAVTLAIDSTVATLTGSQTLTNKTLTAPVITTISNTGTLTLPTSTDTLVGRATTDTLTNKTLTAPNLSGVQITDGSLVFEGSTANDWETTLTVTDPTADRTITFQNGTGTVAFLTDVTGGSTPGSFTTITLNNNITFEGDTANDFETTLAVVDPTADRTISIPDATGTVSLVAHTETSTNKTIDLGNNTLTGSLAEFNTALQNDSFVSLTGSETLTNKTLTSPIITGTGAIAGTFTGNITGDVTGNADTATALASARTIGGTSFDGTANIAVALSATATALASARTIAGQSFDGSGNITIASTDLSDTTSIVLLTSSQTLTNKTLTSPVLNTGVSGSAIKDEDDLTSDSATHLATQQSIKAYVDSQAHLSLIDEDNMASDSATRPPSQQSVKAYVDAQEHSVTATSTTTFTNKTISGASNTITALNATSIGDGSISNTEFQYLNGVSSNIQTQLDNQSTKGFAIAMAIAL